MLIFHPLPKISGGFAHFSSILIHIDLYIYGRTAILACGGSIKQDKAGRETSACHTLRYLAVRTLGTATKATRQKTKLILENIYISGHKRKYISPTSSSYGCLYARVSYAFIFVIKKKKKIASPGRHADVPSVRGLRPQLPQGSTRSPHAVLQAVQHALHVLRERRGLLSVLQQKGVLL